MRVTMALKMVPGILVEQNSRVRSQEVKVERYWLQGLKLDNDWPPEPMDQVLVFPISQVWHLTEKVGKDYICCHAVELGVLVESNIIIYAFNPLPRELGAAFVWALFAGQEPSQQDHIIFGGWCRKPL